MGNRLQGSAPDDRRLMTAMGQKQTSRHPWDMTALPAKADITRSAGNVRFVLKADLRSYEARCAFDARDYAHPLDRGPI